MTTCDPPLPLRAQCGECDLGKSNAERTQVGTFSHTPLSLPFVVEGLATFARTADDERQQRKPGL